MTFDYEMKADGSQAVAESRKVEASLVKVEQGAKAAGAAIDHGFAGDGLRDAAGRFIATSVAADQLRSRAPLLTAAYDAYQNKIRAAAQRTEELGRAQARSAAIVERNAAANQPLVKSFEGLSAALAKEAAMLEQVRGPMRQHQEDVALLTSMYRRGVVTSQEYLTQLGHIDAKKGGGVGGGAESIFSKAGAGALVKEQGGAAGGLVSGIMEGGVGSLATAAGIGVIAEAAKKAVEAIIELGDAYTELSNKALKIASSSQSVEGVLDENLHTSSALHSSLRETLELTDAVKDGTEELNLTTAQQSQLSRGLGAAVRLSNKDISEAGGLLNKLGFALSNGVVTYGEFKSMIKEFPDLMGIMQESTGKSRDELFRMAKAGELSADTIVNAATEAGDAMVDKLGERMETTGEKMQHLKDRFAVAWGGIAQSASSALGKIIDGLADVVDPFKDMREGIEAATHAAQFEAEIDEKMVENAKKLIEIKRNLASLPAEARPEGADFALETAQSYAKLRATMFEVTVAGVNLGAKMKDPMAILSSQATQLSNKIQGIIDMKAGERMAEDAKKAYKAQKDINDVLDAQVKNQADAIDKVAEYEKALTKLAKDRKAFEEKAPSWGTAPQGIMAEGAPSIFGTPSGAMGPNEIMLLRESKDAIDEKNVALGKLDKTAAQALKTERDQKNGLEGINQNYKDGVINATQYAAAIKLLGLEESRLHKIYMEIVGPAREFNLNMAANKTLLDLGRISVSQYNAEMIKLIETFRGKDSSDWRLLDATSNSYWSDAISNIERATVALREYVAFQNQLGEIKTELGQGVTEFARQEGYRQEAADKAASFRAELYNGSGTRNGKTFAAERDTTPWGSTSEGTNGLTTKGIEEATAYTKRWNEELAKNKAHFADMDKFGQQAIGHIEDAFVQAATTGKLSFSSLFKSIEADFARLMAHRLLMALLSGGSGASVFGTGATQAFQGLYGGAHADGGSYTVPGSGGPDSQNVVFRLTPGERVDFTPPGGPSSAAASSASGGLEIHNHFDPRDLAGSLRGNYGRRVIYNAIKNRRGTR